MTSSLYSLLLGVIVVVSMFGDLGFGGSRVGVAFGMEEEEQRSITDSLWSVFASLVPSFESSPKSSNVLVDVPLLVESEEERLEWFARWLDWCDVRAPNVEAGSFENMGLGVRVRDGHEVHEEEEVIKVPMRCVVTPRLAVSDAYSGSYFSSPLSTSGEDAMATFLTVHRLLGSASPWAGYIAALPHDLVPTVSTWSDDELSLLGEPHLEHEAKTLREQLALKYVRLGVEEAVYKALESASSITPPSNLPAPPNDAWYPSYLNPFSPPSRLVTFESFVWAHSILSSRALTLRGSRFLVPLADMFNHEPHPDAREASQGDAFLRHHKVDERKGVFVVVSDRAANGGEQLFEDYGDSPNSIYLSFHGFIHPNNPFDCIALHLPPLVPPPKDLGRKAKRTYEIRKWILRVPLGMAKDTTDRNGPTPPCIPPPTPDVDSDNSTTLQATQSSSSSATDLGLPRWVSAYLRVLDMSEEELDVCYDVLRKSKSREAMEQCFGGSPRGDAVEDSKRWIQVVEKHESISKKAESKASNLPPNDPIPHPSLTLLEPISNTQPPSPPSLPMWTFSATSRKEMGSSTAPTAVRASIAAVAARRRESQSMMRKQLLAQLRRRVAAIPSTPRPRERRKKEQELEEREKEESGGEETYGVVLDQLHRWLDELGAEPRLIEAVDFGGELRLGTRAVQELKQGEVYLGVPHASIMSRETARGSEALSSLFSALDERFPRGDAFHELLFHLLHEFYSAKTKSFFYPYLATLPRPGQFGNGLMWSDDDVAALGQLPLAQSARNYRQEVAQKWEAVHRAVLEPLQKHLPKPEDWIEEHYRWAHAILDSRSIWWNGERHLVPLLDLINCKQGPPGHTIHSTEASVDGKYAITKAPWSFAHGEQVFENYGQPNHIYLLYHGFVLEENDSDCVTVPLEAQMLLTLSSTTTPPTLPSDDELQQRAKSAGFRSTSFDACIPVLHGKISEQNQDTYRAIQFAAALTSSSPKDATRKLTRTKAKRLIGLTAKQLYESLPSIINDEAILARAQKKPLPSDPTGVALNIIRYRVQQGRMLRFLWEAWA